MGEQENSSAMLTDEQRRLVRENVGLVAVHLRRNVVNHRNPKWEGEWDELFQEGCLGLIRAASVYRAERGIPFAAFALPRIHNAVSRAILTKFNIIYIPPRRSSRNDGPSIGVRRDEEARGPKVFALSSHLTDRGRASTESPSPCPLPLEGGEGSNERPCAPLFPQRGRGITEDARSQWEKGDLEEVRSQRGRGVIEGPRSRCQMPEADSASRSTVGERLREKYERAVKEAAQTVSGRASTRGDREQLVRALVEERFLVPEDDLRRPLRHIARDTRSSYGRVADCDRQLHVEIRRTLEADPEFHALQKLCKTDPVGGELRIDEDLECRLAGITAAEFTRRFAAAQRDERASMLQSLLELSPGDLEDIVQSRVATLPTDARERLLRGH